MAIYITCDPGDKHGATMEELNWGPLDFSSCALKPMGHANKYSSSVKSVNDYM